MPSGPVSIVRRPMVFVALIVGLLLGAAAAWLVARARSAGETASLRVVLDH